MKNTTFLVVTTCLCCSWVPVHAQRVYQLVDYAALQNGYTLTGTITTSDTAPDDGLLTIEEVLDWQWSIAGQYAISASSGPLSLTDIQNIAITTSSITLPPVANAQLILRDTINPGRGATVPRLYWSTAYDASNQTSLDRYSATMLFEGDVLVSQWYFETTSSGESPHLVATYVPEPSALVLGAACTALILFPRRP